MTLQEFHNLKSEKRSELLTQCCGSATWVNKMMHGLPVKSLEELEQLAEEKWLECETQDWLDAFEHHPKIGDINSLKKKFANTATWASNEQAGVNEANEKVLEELAKGNDDYEKKFGYIFIVCATGKSAGEMLAILKSRLQNDPAEEIRIASGEQNKITKIRLRKLFA